MSKMMAGEVEVGGDGDNFLFLTFSLFHFGHETTARLEHRLQGIFFRLIISILGLIEGRVLINPLPTY